MVTSTFLFLFCKQPRLAFEAMTESLKENEPEASGLQNRLPSFSLNMLLRNVSITLLINHKIVITFCQELFTPTIKLPNDYWQKNIF